MSLAFQLAHSKFKELTDRHNTVIRICERKSRISRKLLSELDDVSIWNLCATRRIFRMLDANHARWNEAIKELYRIREEQTNLLRIMDEEVEEKKAALRYMDEMTKP